MSGLGQLVTGRSIVVCCGSGGVGKTTTAAAMALEGARRGRRACVVTIDPAKRLADALGLDALANTLQAQCMPQRGRPDASSEFSRGKGAGVGHD